MCCTTRTWAMPWPLAWWSSWRFRLALIPGCNGAARGGCDDAWAALGLVLDRAGRALLFPAPVRHARIFPARPARGLQLRRLWQRVERRSVPQHLPLLDRAGGGDHRGQP